PSDEQSSTTIAWPNGSTSLTTRAIVSASLKAGMMMATAGRSIEGVPREGSRERQYGRRPRTSETAARRLAGTGAAPRDCRGRSVRLAQWDGPPEWRAAAGP